MIYLCRQGRGILTSRQEIAEQARSIYGVDAAQTLDRHSRRLLNPKAQLRQQRLQLLALSTAMTHAARASRNFRPTRRRFSKR